MAPPPLSERQQLKLLLHATQPPPPPADRPLHNTRALDTPVAPPQYAGWTTARRRAWDKRHANPNPYFHNYLHPTLTPRLRKWDIQEHLIFLAALKRMPPREQWGIFSLLVPGRIGSECRRYFHRIGRAGFITLDGRVRRSLVAHASVADGGKKVSSPNALFLRRSLRKFLPKELPEVDDTFFQPVDTAESADKASANPQSDSDNHMTEAPSARPPAEAKADEVNELLTYVPSIPSDYDGSCRNSDDDTPRRNGKLSVPHAQSKRVPCRIALSKAACTEASPSSSSKSAVRCRSPALESHDSETPKSSVSGPKPKPGAHTTRSRSVVAAMRPRPPKSEGRAHANTSSNPLPPAVTTANQMANFQRVRVAPPATTEHQSRAKSDKKQRVQHEFARVKDKLVSKRKGLSVSGSGISKNVRGSVPASISLRASTGKTNASAGRLWQPPSDEPEFAGRTSQSQKQLEISGCQMSSEDEERRPKGPIVLSKGVATDVVENDDTLRNGTCIMPICIGDNDVFPSPVSQLSPGRSTKESHATLRKHTENVMLCKSQDQTRHSNVIDEVSNGSYHRHTNERLGVQSEPTNRKTDEYCESPSSKLHSEDKQRPESLKKHTHSLHISSTPGPAEDVDRLTSHPGVASSEAPRIPTKEIGTSTAKVVRFADEIESHVQGREEQTNLEMSLLDNKDGPHEDSSEREALTPPYDSHSSSVENEDEMLDMDGVLEPITQRQAEPLSRAVERHPVPKLATSNSKRVTAPSRDDRASIGFLMNPEREEPPKKQRKLMTGTAEDEFNRIDGQGDVRGGNDWTGPDVPPVQEGPISSSKKWGNLKAAHFPSQTVTFSPERVPSEPKVYCSNYATMQTRVEHTRLMLRLFANTVDEIGEQLGHKQERLRLLHSFDEEYRRMRTAEGRVARKLPAVFPGVIGRARTAARIDGWVDWGERHCVSVSGVVGYWAEFVDNYIERMREIEVREGMEVQATRGVACLI